MTASDRFDLLLADALQDLAAPQHPDYFDEALDVATRRSQRPAWTFLERWIPMDTATRRTVIAPTFPWRTVGLIVVIIALLVATAAALIIGSQPSTQPAPPFGPAGNGLVVYSANDGDIFVRDPKGGPARLLVGGDQFDVDPAISRDGTQIAFLRLDGIGSPFDPDFEVTRTSILTINPDGSDLREVFTSKDYWGLSWSVDGSQAAIIGGKEGSRTLQVVNIADGSSRSLSTGAVEPTEGVEFRPPDGSELIFRGIENFKYAIYGIRPDGTGLRQISAYGTDEDFWLADSVRPYPITPDGNKLFYGRNADRVELRMLDLDTGQDTLWGGALPAIQSESGMAFTGEWNGAVLSPDGTKIAFGRYWDLLSGTLNHQVFVASVASNGADAIPIGVPVRSPGGSTPFRYSFSPDGRRLIVWFNQNETQGIAEETWMADPTDGSYQKVQWGTVIAPPVWQRVGIE